MPYKKTKKKNEKGEAIYETDSGHKMTLKQIRAYEAKKHSDAGEIMSSVPKY